MKQIEIYDSYPPVYRDNTDNELKVVYTKHREILDTTRYTLVHPSSGASEFFESEDIIEAYSFVATLYEDSKNLGNSYIDRLIKPEDGYAELVIHFNDGKILNRVIYIRN